MSEFIQFLEHVFSFRTVLTQSVVEYIALVYEKLAIADLQFRVTITMKFVFEFSQTD